MNISIEPIGVIRTALRARAGTPVQPCFAREDRGVAEIYDRFLNGLSDIEGFSHDLIIVLLCFSFIVE